jgi:hypothetical protein
VQQPANSLWLKGEREAAAYCRMSLSTWKRFKRSYPIRRIKLPSGSTLYRPEWLDALLMEFCEEPQGDVNRAVEAMMDGIN